MKTPTRPANATATKSALRSFYSCFGQLILLAAKSRAKKGARERVSYQRPSQARADTEQPLHK